ncbi:hypothetical protein NHG60_28245, partial [Citrobacter freundii]|nr:hypothetical protein [Citrobacter freundii]
MFPGQCGNTAFFFKSQPDQFHFEFRGIVFPGKSFFSAHEVSTCKISGCLSYRILDSGPDGTQTTLTVEAFKLLALHGSIPDRYTHQFYATVGELQKRAIDECMVASGMRLLEPNIGLGALLKGLPEGVDVTGFDIHPAAVAITGLRWNVTLNDFLLVKPENTGLFERILMNPPFSDSRW